MGFKKSDPKPPNNGEKKAAFVRSMTLARQLHRIRATGRT